MNYVILARSRTKPGNPFLLKLHYPGLTARYGWDTLDWVPRAVRVGETGRMLQGRSGNRLIPDAYDGE